MSKDKYPSIFSRQMGTVVFIIFQIFFATRAVLKLGNIYRLTHSASELSGFTCTSSLTMNENFQYRTRPPSAVLKISSSLL